MSQLFYLSIYIRYLFKLTVISLLIATANITVINIFFMYSIFK